MQFSQKKTAFLLLALLSCATFKPIAAASAQTSWTTTAFEWMVKGAKRAANSRLGDWTKNKLTSWTTQLSVDLFKNKFIEYFMGGSGLATIFSMMLPFGLNLATPWTAFITLIAPIMGGLGFLAACWWIRTQPVYADRIQPNMFRFIAGHTINFLFLKNHPKWHALVHLFAYFGYPFSLHLLNKHYNPNGDKAFVYLAYEYQLFILTCLMALLPVLGFKFGNLHGKAKYLIEKAYPNGTKVPTTIVTTEGPETSNETNYLLVCCFFILILGVLGYYRKRY